MICFCKDNIVGLFILLLLLAPGAGGQDCESWCPEASPAGKWDPQLLKSLSEGVLSPTIAAPVMYGEPSFTRCDCNVVFWELVADASIEKYRVDWSLDPNFPDSTTLYHFVTSVEDSFHVAQLLDSTYHYRVTAYETSVLYGPPSNTVFSTQDNNPPEIDGALSVIGTWTTLDTFSLQYDIVDPAGVDTAWFYFRTDPSDPWTQFWVADGGGQTNMAGSLPISTAIINEGITDAYFEFAIGARDLTREPAWHASNDQPVGNDVQPDAADQPLGAISVDTHVPQSEITDLDSLQVYATFDIPISAHDTTVDFYSGLDGVILYVTTESSEVLEPIASFGSLEGRATFDTVVTYTAPVNDAIYGFTTIATDVAGNSLTVEGPSTRVFTDLSVSMVLYSEEDPDDNEYTGSCQIMADLNVNSTHVDSFVLCESSDLSTCAATASPTIEDGHIIAAYQFENCSDGEHTVYTGVWLEGKLAVTQSTIILDTQAPQLTWLRMANSGEGDIPWTTSREVSFNFYGNDGTMELQWIVLSESATFGRADSVFLYGVDLPVGVPFTLSGEPERKTVYAKLIDMAEHESDVVADTIDLYEQAHNYPNPFNPDRGSTNFVVAVGQAGNITLRIYDLMGYLVTERTIGVSAGLNDGGVDPQLRWSGHNDAGETVASGGYVCIIENSAGQLISRHKIMVKR